MAAVDWTPELAQSILESIESGGTLRQAAKSHDISPALILKKVSLDESFRERYARVLELRADADFEALMDTILEEPERNNFGSVDNGWVQWKRLQIDTVKWALSKRIPKKYGELMQHEHSGELGIKAILVPAIARSTERPLLKPVFDALPAPNDEEC